ATTATATEAERTAAVPAAAATARTPAAATTAKAISSRLLPQCRRRRPTMSPRPNRPAAMGPAAQASPALPARARAPGTATTRPTTDLASQTRVRRVNTCSTAPRRTGGTVLRRNFPLAVMLAVAASLTLAGGAFAKDRNHDRLPDKWEKRHHLSLHHKQGRRDQD